jgi:importin subunit beta-1
VLAVKSNQVLTAVVQGMRQDETNEAVRHAATVALNNALEFVKANFDNEAERNYIMQTVCEACISTSQKVRFAAYECIVKIAGLYYAKLAPYMQAIFQLTFEEIKCGPDAVAQQAVEFWSTICDEEIALHEEMEEASNTGESPDQVSQDFVKGAMPYLVPLLLQTLTKQDEDQEDDAWNVAMAAGTCLALVSQACGDGVVQHVMEFVQTNIQSANWRFREASTLAFGSILEGPSKAVLTPLVLQAIPIMVTLMRDGSVQVRDTAAWTIGRICDLHAEALNETVHGSRATYMHELIKPGGVLLEALKDEPRVANNVCWAIHNLAESLEVEEGAATSPLSPYFLDLVRGLLGATERGDAAENNLRASAYEALNTVLSQSALDTRAPLHEIVPFLCDKLNKTFAMQVGASRSHPAPAAVLRCTCPACGYRCALGFWEGRSRLCLCLVPLAPRLCVSSRPCARACLCAWAKACPRLQAADARARLAFPLRVWHRARVFAEPTCRACSCWHGGRMAQHPRGEQGQHAHLRLSPLARSLARRVRAAPCPR